MKGMFKSAEGKAAGDPGRYSGTSHSYEELPGQALA